jgi:Propanediol utilization protein
MDNKVDLITDAIMEALLSRGCSESSDKAGISNDSELHGMEVPVGVSNHHVHLNQADLETCFGKGYELHPTKSLTQPGQFACEETVTLCGPKGALEKIRVLGPIRKDTQIELLASDNFKLGIKAPLKLSGDLEGSAGLTVVGPKGSVNLDKGAIVAMRHIHMTPQDAARYGVKDKQLVSIKVPGNRGGIYDNVIVRVTETSALDCHIDTEESNAMNLGSCKKLEMIV